MLNAQTSEYQFVCPLAEISSYLDGELSAESESALEMHLADCGVCRNELNDQKTFLLALSGSLENEPEIDLPANFTKTIVTRAESNVSGLRDRSHSLVAVAIIATIFVTLVLVLGGESAGAFAPIASLAGGVAAVIGMAGQIAYDFAYGTSVFIRSAVSTSAIAYLVLGVALFGGLYLASRSIRRFFRTQGSE